MEGYLPLKNRLGFFDKMKEPLKSLQFVFFYCHKLASHATFSRSYDFCLKVEHLILGREFHSQVECFPYLQP